jgi:hypothetical protein
MLGEVVENFTYEDKSGNIFRIDTHLPKYGFKFNPQNICQRLDIKE